MEDEALDGPIGRHQQGSHSLMAWFILDLYKTGNTRYTCLGYIQSRKWCCEVWFKSRPACLTKKKKQNRRKQTFFVS